MKHLKILFIALILMFVTGTAEAKKIKWDDARKIQIGMTTTEVTKLMGKPYQISTNAEVVRYLWISINAFTGSSRSLYIDFIDGKVAAVPVIPPEFK